MDFQKLYTRSTEVEYLGQMLTIEHLRAEHISKFRELAETDSTAASHFLLKQALPGIEPEKLPVKTLAELVPLVIKANSLDPEATETEVKN